jgi:hypothetical protein
MGKPKKRTSPRRTGTRRSHLVLKLARAVNGKSPVKAFTTRRESGKKVSAEVKSAGIPTVSRPSTKKVAKKAVKKAA